MRQYRYLAILIEACASLHGDVWNQHNKLMVVALFIVAFIHGDNKHLISTHIKYFRDFCRMNFVEEVAKAGDDIFPYAPFLDLLKLAEHRHQSIENSGMKLRRKWRQGVLLCSAV